MIIGHNTTLETRCVKCGVKMRTDLMKGIVAIPCPSCDSIKWELIRWLNTISDE